MSKDKTTVLVLYRAPRAPLRRSLLDHLFAFRRSDDVRSLYVNVAARKLPAWLAGPAFDVVVFHTTVLSARWHRSTFTRYTERLRMFASSPAVKIALPQDEFISTDLLCDFLNELRVDLVFSVAPESEWSAIYSSLDRSRASVRHALTGYLDASTLRLIKQLSRGRRTRSVDIGYRAHGIRHSLGTLGQLKIAIAHAVQDRARRHGLTTDISTDYAQTLYGKAWYRFLLRCRYVIGVEGGASIHDRDGSFWRKAQEYAELHPTAPYAEVRDACFPGQDGTFRLAAISPRHLEACATRTAQLLVEGDYNGILRPNVHYLPVRKDLSDLDAALARVKDEVLRESLTKNAFADVVESGLYTYGRFVDEVIRAASELAQSGHGCACARGLSAWRWAWMSVRERVSWIRPFLRGAAAAVFYGATRHLPVKLSQRLVRWRRARLAN